MSDAVFDKVAIIGIGLLGSSIAHAVKAYGGADTVAMWDVSSEVREQADTLLPGRVETDLSSAVADADCVTSLRTPTGVHK
ncbi:MAG: prephenate/arogenate dehydrogenase family protein, partial [Pseudomonadota bacterium]